MIPKPTKIRSKKIRDSARGESCTVRSILCNRDPETTVFAHLPGGSGTGTKNDDLFGVYSCSTCHDWMDGRMKLPFESHNYKDLLRALQETQRKLVQKELIQLK